ncbi:MAG TPA: hypothetical protein VKQ30_16165 [Ktedonobacterales bacterium]|nr:hypothetical protein [Ktedonobacterales bacterium]
MPLDANSMLGSVQLQMPSGVAANASQMLGLPGLGNNLQDDASAEEFAKRRKLMGLTEGNEAQYGAADMLLGKAV